MDFQELINHADYNAAEVQRGNVKRYSSVLPPPKKIAKSNVQSDSIRRFLEKKKAEEEAKVAQAQREKEKLLALRAQSTKNNKKAKIMASRTKDNDFSKIKLTDDEVEAKRRREAELLRKNLADKVERMKARIELEEKEKLLPRKRKRKSKNNEQVEGSIEDDLQTMKEEYNSTRTLENNQSEKNKIHKQKPLPPPPAMSFSELLKVAEKRQGKPVEIVVKKKVEERPMTKKEKKLREEEIARQKRKQEMLQRESLGLTKSSNSSQLASSNKLNRSEKDDSRKPVVIHVAKDVPQSELDGKFKIPKNSTNTTTNKNEQIKHKDSTSNTISKSSKLCNSSGKPTKNHPASDKKNFNKTRDDIVPSLKVVDAKKKVSVPKKNGSKVNSDQVTASKESNKTPKFDEEALKSKLEKELREKLEKELEERFAAKFAEFGKNQSKIDKKVPDVPKQVKKAAVDKSVSSKRVTEKPSGIFKKDMEKMIEMRKKAMEKSSLKPKLPEKKPFHKNPYLDPPRRLLEPQRPPRPSVKRRLESDDDDDEDDMSDFIDDGTSQNDEDYSKYIQEIFGYDRNRYLDDDDDDIVESSFAEQMKEETRSARLGYLEDLEEERLESERMKRKKLKK